MPHNRRQTQSCRLGKLGYSRRSLGEAYQDRPPSRVRERMEEQREVRIMLSHTANYQQPSSATSINFVKWLSFSKQSSVAHRDGCQWRVDLGVDCAVSRNVLCYHAGFRQKLHLSLVYKFSEPALSKSGCVGRTMPAVRGAPATAKRRMSLSLRLADDGESRLMCCPPSDKKHPQPPLQDPLRRRPARVA